MKYTKKNKNLKPAEFNSLKQELDYAGIEYSLDNYGSSIKLETKYAIFNCSLTGDVKDIENVGAIANAFYKKCKVHDIRNNYGYREIYTTSGKKKVRWDYEIAAGYQYFNSEHRLKWLKCWSYDINSAFPYAMLQPMPDTTKEPRYNSDVREHEIGFYKFGGATTEIGEIADIVFPLGPTPFKEYVSDLYANKKLCSGLDRQHFKNKLNFATGLVARRNIFLRNTIIYYSNKYIKSFIDDDTVYCNVDCIVSLKPRTDLPLGDDIGLFKEEHSNDNFKYKQSGIYQWNSECHYSGIPRGTITDIEHPEGWTKNTKYIYKDGKVIKNEKNRC